MTENNFICSDGNQIKYFFRKGFFDANTLIVIFSGFGAKSLYTYDFSGNSLANCKSHILWIKDEFGGLPSFYLNIHDFNVEKYILEIISYYQNKYLVTKENVLLLGASKGGFAALYYTLKYGFNYCVASAPVINLGSFLNTTQVKKRIFAHLLGKDYENDIKNNVLALNKKLFSLLDCQNAPCITLITSPVDEHDTGDDFVEECRKNRNITLRRVQVNSDLVYQHNVITRYCSNFISSICGLFSYGIKPVFQDKILETKSNENYIPDKNALAVLNEISFENDCITAKGFGFIKGIPSPSYGLFSKKIILKSRIGTIAFTVGSIKEKDLTSKYFDQRLINYETGGFQTIKGREIKLDKIPESDHFLNFEIIALDTKERFVCPVQYTRKPQIFALKTGFLVIYSINGQAVLRKTNYISEYKPTAFKISSFNIDKKKLNVEGGFIVRSVPCEQWGELSPYLVLQNAQNLDEIVAFKLGQKTDLLNRSFLGEIGPYARSSFSNINNQGIDIKHLKNGIYNLYVSAFVAGADLYSHKVGQLKIDEKTVRLVNF